MNFSDTQALALLNLASRLPLDNNTNSDADSGFTIRLPLHKKHNILSIDGGGVRCVIAMEVLCALEKSIQDKAGNPNRLLCDEFDLIAGTSAGGMLASAIALGMSMQEIRVFVETNIHYWFSPMSWYKRHKALYDKTQLSAALREGLGASTTLGSNKLKTGLMLMTHNWSEDAEWLLTNRSGAAPDNDPDDSHLDLLLWQVTLASASAPAYFTPETFRYGRRAPRDVVLQDGGMAGFLNPAFRAFRYATESSTGPKWQTGEDSLNLVSIGSGDASYRRDTRSASGRGVMRAMMDIPNTLLTCSVREQEALCQLYGKCATPTLSNSGDNGDTKNVVMIKTPSPKLFSYHRINPCLDTPNLSRLGFSELTAGQIMPMDKSGNYSLLSDIGKKTVEESDIALIAGSCAKGAVQELPNVNCDLS